MRHRTPRRHPAAASILPAARIERTILLIRGRRVILDADLASHYGVRTKALNQAIRRNPGRFPTDFVFRLTSREKTKVVTNCDHLSGLKYSPALPLAFTEHGALMAANLLNSPFAVATSVEIIRAFTRLKRTLRLGRRLSDKLAELERRVGGHDAALNDIIGSLKELLEPPPDPPQPRMGFR